jgi:hypothetical protein
MDILTGAGLAAPAGLNAYIPLLAVGLLARFTDLVTLQAPYDIISSDAGLIVLAILLIIELFADAVPGLDTVNDVVQTAIRPAAGAFLMLASDGDMIDMHPILQMLIGAGLAGAVHAVKALGRPVITMSTGGLGNPGVSSIENVLALILSVLAILIPVAVLVGAVLLLILGVRWLMRHRSAIGER